MTQEDGIFLSHADYVNILYYLNISDDQKQKFLETYEKKLLDIFESEDMKSQIQDILDNQVKNFQDFYALLEKLIDASNISEQ